MDYIPSPERTNLCFITYNQMINFYSLNKSTQSDVQIISVGELDDDSIPYPKSRLFFNVEDEKDNIL